jgi:hypothetical protein
LADSQAAKRSGGYDQQQQMDADDGGGGGLEDYGEDDGEETTEDGEDGVEGEKKKAKRRKQTQDKKLGLHGKHVHKLSAARIVKPQPVRNMTQVANEMGFVEFTEKAKIKARAEALDRELLLQLVKEPHAASAQGTLNTFLRWYAAGTFTSLAASDYLKSVRATSTTQIALTRVNENDVSGLSGAKMVTALTNVAKIAVALFNKR